MVLDYNCVRDVLLSVENVTGLDSDFKLKHISVNALSELPELSAYSLEQITYTVLKLKEFGYLNASALYGNGKVVALEVSGLSNSGHEFLELVRPLSRWQKAQILFSKVAELSVPIIFETCLKLATSSVLS